MKAENPWRVSPRDYKGLSLTQWGEIGFPGVPVVKNPPAGEEDEGSIPGSRRSPGGGNGNALQYSRLEKPMDRGAWQAAVHGVTKVGHNLDTEHQLQGKEQKTKQHLKTSQFQEGELRSSNIKCDFLPTGNWVPHSCGKIKASK